MNTLRAVPRVVIVGAGFAGLRAAKLLARAQVDVLILDSHNYHTFFPLLYQIAAAELEPEDIIYPIRSLLRGKKNIRLAVEKVTSVEVEKKTVSTAEHVYPYDYLLLAPGSRPHFYAIEGASENAFQLRNLEAAITLRNHIITRFERALSEPDAEKRRRLLTFAVIGGGPTGVEFAGAFAELIHGPLTKDYATLNFKEVRLLLIEAGDHLLPGLSERLQNYALKRLEKMGVEILRGNPVTRIQADQVTLKDGTILPTETAVWTAGVRGAPPKQTGDLPILRTEQVDVLPTLQAANHADIYIAGDLAHVEENGRPLPLLATLAIQEGDAAARNILRQINGEDPVPFHYHDEGTVAAIGRNSAAVHMFGRDFTGFLAWVFWVGLHIYRLIGFRNKLFLMINWAWDYLFFERGVRLIIPTVEDV